MKIVAVLCLLFVAASSTQEKETCHSNVDAACPKEPIGSDKKTLVPTGCTAAYGAFPRLDGATQKLAEAHIKASMSLLIMGNHFSEWEVNRKGFQDYFHTLSDKSWDDAISLIKHMVIRGGKVSELSIPAIVGDGNKAELDALSTALDIERKLVEKSLALMSKTSAFEMSSNPVGDQTEHSESHTIQGKNVHSDANSDLVLQMHHGGDGEFAHFLADEVSEKLIMRVKLLANHVNALSEALDSQSDINRGTVLHLYDQILQGGKF